VALAFAALVPIVLHVRNTASTRGNDKIQTEVAESHSSDTIAPRAPGQPLAEKAVPAPQNRIGPPPRASDRLATSSRQIGTPAGLTDAPAKARDAASEPSNQGGSNLQTSTASFAARGIVGGIKAAPAAPKPSIIAGATGGPVLASPPPAVPSQIASDAATPGDASDTVTVSNANLAPIETVNSLAQGTLKVAALSPLPSGLPTLSTTSSGQVTLALDSRNTLFYSSDNGGRWKTIPSQWKGQAVKVHLVNNSAPSMLNGIARGYAGSFAAASPAALDAKTTATALSSSVAGTVTDTTGASIPNAAVAVSNAAKQTVQTARTDASGHYLIPGLSAGTYQIEAAAPGFQTLELPVTLASSQQNISNLQLQVGSVSETVTVTSASQPVATRKSLDKKSTAPPATARPTALFEITTDTGDHWVSFDGQNWAHK
jgi:hypothetical protein